jgi:probable F420-dependent oxidoreductase
MELGFSTMNTPNDLRPDVLGRALEDRGYTSLFIGEHSHIPTSRETPYPAGGEMPDQYRRMMDPFLSLAMAASATSKLAVGTGVCLVLEHHVLDLAKQVATLDVLTGGRVLFGVGVGWNVEELTNHRPDISWGQRYQAAEECVSALRSCWTDDESSFDGKYFMFEPVWSFPKPAQRPHPPVLFGGAGRVGMAHTIKWADEWMPIDVSLGNVAKRIGQFRAATEAAGRDIPVSIITFGDPSRQTLEHYSELGVARTIIGSSRTGWDDPSTTLPFLDHYAPMIADFSA